MKRYLTIALVLLMYAFNLHSTETTDPLDLQKTEEEFLAAFFAPDTNEPFVEENINIDLSETDTEYIPEMQLFYPLTQLELPTRTTYAQKSIDTFVLDQIIASAPEKTQRRLQLLLQQLSQETFIEGLYTKVLIFEGPPGVGKTTIAQGIAQMAGVPYKFINATSLFTKYQFSAQENLRKEIEPHLNSNKKIVIVIDEIDKLIGTTSGKEANSSDTCTKEDATTAFWSLLDHCNNNVVIIGTTNNLDNLPKQLQDRLNNSKLTFPNPSLKIKKDIFLHYLKKFEDRGFMTYCTQEEIMNVVEKLKNVSPRSIETLVQAAAQNAYVEKDCDPEIHYRHFIEPLNELVPGYWQSIKLALIQVNNNKMQYAKTAFPYVATAVGLGITIYFAQKHHNLSVDQGTKSFALAKEQGEKSLALSREQGDKSLLQNQNIADQNLENQNSLWQWGKQTATSFISSGAVTGIVEGIKWLFGVK